MQSIRKWWMLGAFVSATTMQNAQALEVKEQNALKAIDTADDAADANAKAIKANPNAPSYVRVLHAIPNAPAVDVYFGGQKTLSALAFKTLSDYRPIKSGSHTFTINATGKTENLVSEKKNLVGGSYYTIAAVTTAGRPSFFVQNESSGGMTAGQARVRIYHLSPGTPPVEISTANTTKQSGFARLFDEPIAYKKGVSRLLAPGTYALQVRAGGNLLQEIPNVLIEPDKRYSIFALGQVVTVDKTATNTTTTANKKNAAPSTFEVIVKTAAIK